MNSVGVTGASGFVGSAVATRLLEDGYRVVGLTRGNATSLPEGVERWVGDIGGAAVMEAVGGCAAVIHAAARVHVMKETSTDPLAEFRSVNVAGTENLATYCAAAGVKRFVFVSSIKVLGESTELGRPFRASDLPGPQDPYGLSKAEAEEALARVCRHTGMEYVVVRPVLVYGPGVRGNFKAMLGWLRHGVPLPLGAVANQRSLVGLPNLVDFLVRALEHPSAVNRAWLVSDGEDLSTPELLRRAARAMNREAHLLPLPPALLRLAGRVLGNEAAVRRLTESLQVDISDNRTVLQWTPPFSVDAVLATTTQAFLQEMSDTNAHDTDWRS